MLLKRLLTSFLVFICIGMLFGQKPDASLRRAQVLYQNGRFKEALRNLQQTSYSKGQLEFSFLEALCYYELNELDRAFNLLRKILNDKRSNFAEAHHFLGQIYHDRNQFKEASEQFLLYLKTLRPDHPDRAIIIEKLRRCDNGQRLKFRENRVVVENLGPRVNTPGDEFGPVMSPNNSGRLYFSAVRPDNVGGLRNAQNEPDPILGAARSDMYATKLNGTSWSAAEPLHYLLNSPRHELVLNFSRNGQKLYFYQGWDMSSGDFLVDTFQNGQSRQLQTFPFISPLDVRQGDGTPYLFNDTLLIFSSRRAGGQGGLDLWQCRRIGNSNRWSVPENLGPRINSAYDETTPFLSVDGRTLYYSTNNSEISIGGFDVVKSFFVESTATWTLAENVGLPINSAADDTHFRLARDGFTSFLASSRRDGFGKRDIYVAYYQDFQQEMEPLISFQPNLPDLSVPSAPPPVPVSIQPEPSVDVADSELPIRSTTTATPKAELPTTIPPTSPSTPTTATAYVIPFPGVQLPSDGATVFQLDDALSQLETYPAAQLIITAYSPSTTSSALFEGIKRAQQVAAYLVSRGANPQRLHLRSVAEKETTSQVLLNFSFPPGNGGADHLPVIGVNTRLFASSLYNQLFQYKVQIVSTRKEAYQNDILLERFGQPMVETRPGFGFYRYTVGATSQYHRANEIRQQLLDAGISGAFIVAYFQGRRIVSSEVDALSAQFPDIQQYR